MTDEIDPRHIHTLERDLAEHTERVSELEQENARLKANEAARTAPSGHICHQCKTRIFNNEGLLVDEGRHFHPICHVTMQRDSLRQLLADANAVLSKLPTDDTGAPLVPNTRYWWHKRGEVFSGYYSLIQTEPLPKFQPATWAAAPGCTFSTRSAAESALSTKQEVRDA